MQKDGNKALYDAIKKYHIEQYFSDINDYICGMKLVTYRKNTMLYERAEHRKYAYFFLAGEFQVDATDENGNHMLIRHCDKFIFLGDMELLGYDTMVNIVHLLTDCIFVAIDTVLLKDKMLSDPIFLRFLCNCLAEKINNFSHQQFHNQNITSRQKIASHILMAGGESGFYKENLRRTSEILSISYRHLHRILSEMVDAGILERKDNGYLIKKMDYLEKYFWDNEK